MNSGDFHDIVSGSNYGYSAGVGYDMVTGIGTPVANNLVPDFVPATSKGTVAFDAATYQFGTYASITVADLDLISDASCPVKLTSRTWRQRDPGPHGPWGVVFLQARFSFLAGQ